MRDIKKLLNYEMQKLNNMIERLEFELNKEKILNQSKRLTCLYINIWNMLKIAK